MKEAKHLPEKQLADHFGLHTSRDGKTNTESSIKALEPYAGGGGCGKARKGV